MLGRGLVDARALVERERVLRHGRVRLAPLAWA